MSRHCFRPQPEVESAVVTLTLRGRRPVSVRDEEAFIRTVRAAFAHRRKTIANSLRDEGWVPEAIRRALETAGVQPSRRAETLSLAEFAAVADALVAAG